MDWSDYLAIGGAVGGAAGLASFVWKIIEWHLKQARIKVRVKEEMLFEQGRALNGVVVEIINFGKETTKITGIGFMAEVPTIILKSPYGHTLPGVFGKSLPYELKGNDKYKAFVSEELLLRLKAKIPLVVYCEDAIGKVYYSKKYKILAK